MMTVSIRRVSDNDIDDVIALVRRVVFDVYAALIERNGAPPPGDRTRWKNALIALCEDQIVGVGLANENFISDLWIETNFRNLKIGAELLMALEMEIHHAGYRTASLRVVAENSRAQKFYSNHGWRAVRQYPHERDSHLMIDMEKRLNP